MPNDRLYREMSQLFQPCITCGHFGFSHDNWSDCAECECEQFTVEESDE